jgi:hypothetical protein
MSLCCQKVEAKTPVLSREAKETQYTGKRDLVYRQISLNTMSRPKTPVLSREEKDTYYTPVN